MIIAPERTAAIIEIRSRIMSPPVAELLVVQIKRDQGSRETRRTIHSEIPTPVIRIAIKLTSQILSATSALYAIMHARTGGRGFDDGGRKLLRDSPLRRDSSTVRLWPQAVESHDGDVFIRRTRRKPPHCGPLSASRSTPYIARSNRRN